MFVGITCFVIAMFLLAIAIVKYLGGNDYNIGSVIFFLILFALTGAVSLDDNGVWDNKCDTVEISVDVDK